MAKTITGKRVKFGFDFYWRGKRKTPSVSVYDASGPDEDDFFGIPDEGEFPEWDAFYTAAREFCKALVKAGELD